MAAPSGVSAPGSASAMASVEERALCALNNFLARVQEGGPDVRHLLSAMRTDEVVYNMEIETSYTTGRVMEWDELCSLNAIQGPRLEEALEATLDLRCCCLAVNNELDRPILLRDLVEDNKVMWIDWLLGAGFEESVCGAWTMAAIYLARHPHYSIPNFTLPEVDI